MLSLPNPPQKSTHSPESLTTQEACKAIAHTAGTSFPQASTDVSPQVAPYIEEWRDSCVSDAIISANVRYVEGDEALDLLTQQAIESMGGWAAQYATGKVVNLRKRYEHVEAGGWWVSGLDPLNDWAPMEWGQFKPLAPRLSYKNSDKTIKYETLPGVEARAIFLDGATDWRQIQADIAAPRIWGEGAKKAGAALTAGYAAIALPGVYSGYRSKDALGNPIAPYLIPEAVAMAQPGSVHYLAFDQDDKPETRRKVAIALSRFGLLLKAEGCEVRVVQWSAAKGKGIDDLIAAEGAEAFHQAVNSALTLEEWQLWQALDNKLTIKAAIQLKTHDLTVLSPESVPDTGIIAIASPKATGKTNLIGGLIAGKDKALLAGHRISLMRNLSERCGVNYRGDLDKQGGRFMAGDAYTLRVGTCVDSLLAIDPGSFAGCDLVLDEVVQVLRHLLTSSTCNKDGKRPVLLGRFAELLQAARRVILADADLDNKAINYIQQLRGDAARPFLIRNDYKAPGYAVRFIESADASAITGELLRDLQAGKRVFIVTDSKGASKRLDRVIGVLKRDIPRLLINSETSGGAVERGFMENPDRHLTTISLQAVIASPSAGTGISIEGNHSDKVYGIFYGGSITDADMSQALMRVRPNIPRVVWCAKHGNAFSKVGRDSSALKLRNMLKQKTDANTHLIRFSLTEMTREGISGYDWANDPHVGYWAEIEAERNRSMWNLRTALKVRLMHEGHQLEVVELEKDGQVRDLLRAAREELKAGHAIAVEAAANLTPAEAKALADIDGLDEAQRLALEKWNLAEFYCIPVDQVEGDLVLWDNEGRRRGQLLNLESFLHPDTAIAADVRSLDKQMKWGKGVTPWDLNNASLKRMVRDELRLDEYLEPGKSWDSASLQGLKETALKFSAQIKAALNFSVKDDMPAAQILNQLLEQMGIECKGKQQRTEGVRLRTYKVDDANWQVCNEVVDRRKARRERLDAENEPVTPPLSIVNQLGGCDTLKAPEIATSALLPAHPATSPPSISTYPDKPLDDGYYNQAAWGVAS